MTLTDLMDKLGKVQGFSPEPTFCPKSDTVTMYFDNTASYAQRIDNFLTVFKSFDSDEMIGFKLKGVLRKMRELKALIGLVDAKTPKVHVKLILWACMAEGEKEVFEPYQEAAKRTEEFDDAKIAVPA
jgi:hypothetical protein